MARNRVLICGSRKGLTPQMIQLVWRLIRAVKTPDLMFPSLYGALINAGDAVGIDWHVIGACNSLGVEYVCYGITATGRNPAARVYVCTWHGGYTSAAYPDRDRHMVRASSHCIGLKSTTSTTRGTDLTCEYAASVLAPDHTLKYTFNPLTGKVKRLIL